jgi:hypothetical protein
MKWAFVPEREGIYEIPKLTLAFFDTASDEYRGLETSGLSLRVLPGKQETVHALTDPDTKEKQEGPTKKAVEEIGRDILPVHTSLRDLTAGRALRPGGIVFWLTLLAPFLIYAATYAGLRFRHKSAEATAAAKAKKAAGKLSQQCRVGAIAPRDLLLSVRDYLNDRFGLALGTLTPFEATRILKSEGAQPETSEQLRNVLQSLEDAVYTGRGNRTCDLGGEIAQLIKQIEKEIK